MLFQSYFSECTSTHPWSPGALKPNCTSCCILPDTPTSFTSSSSPILPHHHLLLLSAVSPKWHLPLLISKHHILPPLLRPKHPLLLLPSDHQCLPAPSSSPLLLFLFLLWKTPPSASPAASSALLPSKYLWTAASCCRLRLMLRFLFLRACCFCNTPNHCSRLLPPNSATLVLHPSTHHLLLQQETPSIFSHSSTKIFLSLNPLIHHCNDFSPTLSIVTASLGADTHWRLQCCMWKKEFLMIQVSLKHFTQQMFHIIKYNTLSSSSQYMCLLSDHFGSDYKWRCLKEAKHWCS